MTEYLETTLAILRGQTLSEGADLILEILATWVDMLVDRTKMEVSVRVREYAHADRIPIRWQILPSGEMYWRTIHFQFHMRMLEVRMKSDDFYFGPPQLPQTLAAVNIGEHLREVAKYLSKLSIEAALDWLVRLSYAWAATYDLATLRSELRGIVASVDEIDDARVRHYPIGLLANATES